MSDERAEALAKCAARWLDHIRGQGRREPRLLRVSRQGRNWRLADELIALIAFSLLQSA